MKNAKFNVNTALLAILAIVAVGTAGWMTDWGGFAPSATGTTGDSPPPSKEGDLGTLKVKSVFQPTASSDVQFPGTGFAWDVSTPGELIETVDGKALSATSGTTFSPAYRGHKYAATAFGTGYYCNTDSKDMVAEGVELKATCKNETIVGSELTLTLFEKGTAETVNTGAFALPADSTKTFNKFGLELNQSNRYFRIAAACIGSNVSNSHVSNWGIDGWSSVGVPSSVNGATDDFCVEAPNGEIALTPNSYKEFDASMSFESDATGTGGAGNEAMTLVFLPKCQFVSKADGTIKEGWFKDDTSKTLCSGQEHNYTITLT